MAFQTSINNLNVNVYCTYGHLQADFLSLCPERSREQIQHIFMYMHILHNNFTLHEFKCEDDEKVGANSSLSEERALNALDIQCVT